MKILSIGNSFSEDAHQWLHKLAEMNGLDIYTVNLCVSGCTLQTHWEGYTQNRAECALVKNGGATERYVTIAEALTLEDWDIVTVQQASRFSGLPDTHEPYLANFIQIIQTACPRAKIWYHQTWAYEKDSPDVGYTYYDHDQQKMYNAIMDTSAKIAQQYHLPLIPVGKVIQGLRENLPEFDYGNGGISLNRDGSHLSLDYGRFAAAATWIKKLTGKELTVTEFEDFDVALLQKICDFVNKEVSAE